MAWLHIDLAGFVSKSRDHSTGVVVAKQQNNEHFASMHRTVPRRIPKI